MRFQNMTLNRDIDSAITIATNLFHPDSKMMRELSLKNDFKYDSGRGAEVVIRLVQPKPPIKVFTYRPINPFTRAIGFFDGEAIHINSRKLPKLSTQELVGLLLHEDTHYYEFNHGTGLTANYKTQEKCLYSVPYFLSENVKRWL